MIPSKLAVVVHIYYLELWDEIIDYLQKIESPFDLFITTTFEKEQRVRREVKNIFPEVHIRTHPNERMDFFSFLCLIPELAEKRYLAVCKLYTKKGDDELGSVWRQALLQSLLGSNKTIQSISNSFSEQDDLAMVGTGAFYLSTKKCKLEDNDNNLEILCNALNINNIPADWGRFEGGMFWVKPDIFLPLALIIEEYPELFNQTTKHSDIVEHRIECVTSLLPLLKEKKIAKLFPAIGSKSYFILQYLTPKNTISQINQTNIKPLLHQYQKLHKNRTLFLQKGLFNSGDYLKKFPYLLGLQVDLISHYLLVGSFQKIIPNIDFDLHLCSKSFQRKISSEERNKDKSSHSRPKKTLALRKKSYSSKKNIKNFTLSNRISDNSQLNFLGMDIGWIKNDKKILRKNAIYHSNLHMLKYFAELHSVNSTSFLKIGEYDIKNSRFFHRLELDSKNFQLPFVIKYNKWRVYFSDLWFATDYLLKINLESILPDDDVVIIKYYQYDFTQGVLVKIAEDTISNTNFHILDVPLLNPLLPLLIIVVDSDGRFLTSSFIPFPSLFRGGMHYSEVYALTEGELYIDSIFSYSFSLLLCFFSNKLMLSDFLVCKLNIMGEMAGDEKIFNPYLNEWLLNIFKVRLLPTKLNTFMNDEMNVDKNVEHIREGDRELFLNSCSIPTIAVLVEKKIGTPVSAFIVSPYIMADFIGHTPKASVIMPTDNSHSFLFKNKYFPVYKSDKEYKKGSIYNINFPVAIHFYRKESYSPASKIYALSPDRKKTSSKIFSIDIVVMLSFDDDLNNFKVFLYALSNQNSVEINKIIVVVKKESGISPKKIDLLLKNKSLGNNIFSVPKRISFMEDMLSCCMQYTERELVLFIKDTVLLHDQYTLRNLCEEVVSNDNIATASCQIVTEVKPNVFESIYGGYLGREVKDTTLYSNSQLGCELFEKITYPVIANNFDCTIIKRMILHDFNHIFPNTNIPIPLGNTVYLDFGIRMIEFGYRHICIGEVVAINTSKKIRNPNVKINLSPNRLAAIMGRLILINNFKS